ncbi:hypothetical protein [Thauera sp. Sel9]|uniref:hypothetical protein n=1 Tax=Thauera sp. Sel9 TaxID=2974299 RepID=UPI0021E16845|nr:hypothetical protein [Thauera sp. Sel9]MCV2218529.1 hypothetical protein [Thauera sp. Sel9]
MQPFGGMNPRVDGALVFVLSENLAIAGQQIRNFPADRSRNALEIFERTEI